MALNPASGRAIPPNLGDARRAFTNLLGEDAVLWEEAPIAEFRDPFEGPGAKEHRPSLVVQPSSTEEVQACLALANRLELFLWTSSMGRNFGYGGSAPVMDASIVLNLRRMNRILEIDAQQGFALVEPGVTFFQLYEALREQNAPLMMSVPDLGWGSMIGNALEHGLGYNIMGEHASALCGLEVALPDGNLIRTGQGGISGSPLWNCHRRGFGPSLDDLFKQSNLGVVTKAGIQLSPRPEKITAATLRLDGDNGIVPLIETLRPLIAQDVLQGVPMLVGTPHPEATDEVAGSGGFSFDNLRKVLRPGRWNLRFGLYGPQEMVAARRAMLERAFAALPDAQLEMREYAGDAGPEDVDPRDLITVGIPNMVLKDRLESVFGETLGHQDFSPVLPLSGEVGQAYDRMVREVMREFGVVGAVGMLLHKRSMTGASMIMFDREDAAQVANVRAAVQLMGERAAEWGCAPYRSHVSMVDQVAGRFDFNDHALMRAIGQIKDALDPQGILAPGNHGIWPRRLRERADD